MPKSDRGDTRLCSAHGPTCAVDPQQNPNSLLAQGKHFPVAGMFLLLNSTYISRSTICHLHLPLTYYLIYDTRYELRADSDHLPPNRHSTIKCYVPGTRNVPVYIAQQSDHIHSSFIIILITKGACFFFRQLTSNHSASILRQGGGYRTPSPSPNVIPTPIYTAVPY